MNDTTKIVTNDEERKGRYANFTLASHRRSEFILDFIFVEPVEKGESAMLAHRVIMSPKSVKSMINVLNENMEKYEKAFGEEA